MNKKYECPVCARKISKEIWDKQEKKADECELCDYSLYLELQAKDKNKYEVK